VCLAVDIDAAGLDPEESDPPPHQRSPKASPNTVISPLAREKRMPFFKKVKLADGRSLVLHVSSPPTQQQQQLLFSLSLSQCSCHLILSLLSPWLFFVPLYPLDLFLFVCFSSSFPQLYRGISR